MTVASSGAPAGASRLEGGTSVERIDTRSAVAGAALAVVLYLVVTVMLLPLAVQPLVRLGSTGAAAVVLLSQVGLLLVVGVVVALLVRRRSGLASRRSALSTALVAGGAGAVVVLVLGSAAAAATSAGRLTGGALLTVLALWLAFPALGSTLVAPGAPVRSSYTGADPVSTSPGAPDAPAPVRVDGGFLRREGRVRYDSETGAATLETLGVTIVAALLVGVLVATMTPAGTWLSDNVKAALCRIVTLGQGDCAATTYGDAAHKPDAPCVLSTSTDTHAYTVDITFVHLGGGGTVKVEQLSDGTYRVSLEGAGEGGVTAGIGGGFSVTVNDNQYGGEASADAAAYAMVTAGATWVVGKGDKDKLVGYLKDKRNWSEIGGLVSGAAGPLGPIAGGAVEAGHDLWNWVTGDDYSPPSPDQVYGQVGVGGDAGASAVGITGGASAGVSMSTALGARYDMKTGRKTVYFAVDVAGDASANTGYAPTEGGRFAAGGVGKAIVGVELGGDGRPVSITAQSLAAGDATAQITDLFAGSVVDANPSGGTLYTAKVDLTNPEALRMGTDLLSTLGIVPGNRAASTYDALRTFVNAAKRDGILTRQAVSEGSGTPFAIDASGKVGIELGASYEMSNSSVTSGDASYFNGKDWVPWSECTS